jgi:hypothetical protein
MARLGYALYWIACAVTVVIAVGCMPIWLTDPVLAITGCVVAGLIWVFGRAIRYVLAAA